MDKKTYKMTIRMTKLMHDEYAKFCTKNRMIMGQRIRGFIQSELNNK